ncbi:MAG: LuxR C-terminal-related transcriptional regulator [Gaiellaceae bacterium]
MAASTSKPTVRRERRIIERPRLIKLLDESEARIILLLAPAGYGKTTLARQWAKTLNGSIWVGLTPAHRDVVTFAEDIARGIEGLGGEATSFISEFVRAQSNPQRAARQVAEALREPARAARVQWLILDDYHEIASAPEIGEMIAHLQADGVRVLVASRLRPAFTTQRRILYGEVMELNQADLAMNDEESRAVLGANRGEQDELLRHAKGWPAVLALAAVLDPAQPVIGGMEATLHQYVADELFRTVPMSLQAQLISLALLPELSRESVVHAFGDGSGAVLDRARDLGFLGIDDGMRLHPLIRDFLLVKLEEMPEARPLVGAAINDCIGSHDWDQALDLARRFSLSNFVQSILEAAYKPLVHSGRIASLSRIATEVRKTTTQPAPEADLVDAEVAFRDGQHHLAAEIAGRVRERLHAGHALRSRAAAIQGGALFQLGIFEESEQTFACARDEAADDADLAEALHGLVLASLYGERPSADLHVTALGERAKQTGAPVDVARHAASALARMRIGSGFVESPFVEDALLALPRIEDPRVRTSVLTTLTYSLALQCEYERALELAEQMIGETEAFGLQFARPHGQWNLAFVKLGLRRFTESDRLLQAMEAELRIHHVGHSLLNARVLRSRLLMQIGRRDEAYTHVRYPFPDKVSPPMYGEYIATRALSLSLLGRSEAALEDADAATSTSVSSEVHVLAEGARSIIAAESGDDDGARSVLVAADQRRVWDPAILCLRASPVLAASLARQDDLRGRLGWLYERTNDTALARRAGLRTRTHRAPSDVLSPREREVLELMAQGFRNREIAAAFVISQSTVKVHVRHIFEKLGVRTRTQAVAQLQALAPQPMPRSRRRGPESRPRESS